MKTIYFFLLSVSLFHAQAQKQIAITFDDLPFVQENSLKNTQKSTEKLLNKLQKAQIPTVGFVNEKNIYQTGEIEPRIALLEKWLKNGHELGNHTFSHQSFSKISLEAFENETIKGEVLTDLLRKKYQQTDKYFRFPFLHNGSDSVKKYTFQAFLEQNNYKNAPVTMDADDWYFNKVYVDAQRKADSKLMQQIAQSYLQHTEAYLEYYEKLSDYVVGRPMKHIFLCHANALNSDYFEQIIAIFQQKNYQFISLKEALNDEIYQRKESVITANGFSWLHRWRMTDAKKNTLKDPEIPEYIRRMYEGK